MRAAPWTRHSTKRQPGAKPQLVLFSPWHSAPLPWGRDTSSNLLKSTLWIIGDPGAWKRVVVAITIKHSKHYWILQDVPNTILSTLPVLTHFILINNHKVDIIIILFHKWRHGSKKRLGDLPSVSQLTRSSKAPEPMLFSTALSKSHL